MNGERQAWLEEDLIHTSPKTSALGSVASSWLSGVQILGDLRPEMLGTRVVRA